MSWEGVQRKLPRAVFVYYDIFLNCIKKITRNISTYSFTRLRIRSSEGHVAMFTLTSFHILFTSTRNLQWTCLNPSSSLPSFHLIYLLVHILSTSRIFLHYALSPLFFFPEVLFRPAHLLLQNGRLLVIALEQQLKRKVWWILSKFHTNVS